MKKHFSLLAVAVVAMIFSSCSHTAITSTWHDVNEPPRSFDKVAIVVMVPSKANRGTIENAIAAEFKAQGIHAISTMGIFPNADKVGEEGIDKEAIEKKVKEKVRKNQIDAIMIVGLMDTKQEQYYVEGSHSYGTPYYGGYGSPYSYPLSVYPMYGYSYYGYYSHFYSTIYSPGYYVNTTTYFMESSLFETENGKMLWSAQSETTDPVSVQRESETFAEIVVGQMLRDRAVEPK